MTDRPSTVSVTKSAKPPIPAVSRRSRVPEIDRLLERWQDAASLTYFEREILRKNGLAADLTATRSRAPKISYRAKACLLLAELARRRWETPLGLEGLDFPEERVKRDKAREEHHLRLATTGHLKHLVERPLGVVDRAISSEDSRAIKSLSQLERELGAGFVNATIDREAQVRQWEHRRRKRENRVGRPAAGPILRNPERTKTGPMG